MSVVIETTLGDITVDLFLKDRPNTCLNFLKLCKIKYYNLCLFHKIERNFIAQTGDPTATGRGGESVFCHLYGEQAKYFEAEMKPRLKHEKLGTLSMVNNGNSMNGSQFFLTLGENLTYLDEDHTVFGEVVEGFETLIKINEAICGPDNRPYQDIRITHTVVLHDPYDDPSGLEVPDRSPIPTREQLESNYIGADEEIDDTKGKSMDEIEEKIKESEAKARATILEMVGDIPDVDVKPPENVLFVCKLNPVTTSEDLEIIFSRFGHIVSCEVIKDHQTGDSLQYAFIEFEKEEDCENAYFKMDNVLIDDRRIHVDFSQSVSKMNWEQKNSEKGRSKEYFSIKGRKEKTDGYEMIFDMSEQPKSSSVDKRSESKHQRDLDKKHSSRNRDSKHQTKDSRRYAGSCKLPISASRHADEELRRNKDRSSYSTKKYLDKDRYHKSDKLSKIRNVSPDKGHKEKRKDVESHYKKTHTKEKKQSKKRSHSSSSENEELRSNKISCASSPSPRHKSHNTNKYPSKPSYMSASKSKNKKYHSKTSSSSESSEDVPQVTKHKIYSQKSQDRNRDSYKKHCYEKHSSKHKRRSQS